VVMTAPHIGNTGMNLQDEESGQIWVAGFVVRDPARRFSSWRATTSLDAELERQDIVSISGIDTRALTRHLRDRGAMRAGIFSGAALPPLTGEHLIAELTARVQTAPRMSGADLAREVTTLEAYAVEPPEGVDQIGTVVAVDLGIKDMTPVRMAER